MARESRAPSNNNPRTFFWWTTGRCIWRCSGWKRKGWVKAAWGISENNRRARFYTLTAKGRNQLTQKTDQWRRVANAIARILAPGEAEG